MTTVAEARARQITEPDEIVYDEGGVTIGIARRKHGSITLMRKQQSEQIPERKRWRRCGTVPIEALVEAAMRVSGSLVGSTR